MERAQEGAVEERALGLGEQPPAGLPSSLPAGSGEPRSTAGWFWLETGRFPDTRRSLLSRYVSSGVWEVYGAVVVGPEPEQFVQRGILPRRRHSELAKLPGVFIEREVEAGKKTGTTKKLFKNENKNGKVGRR